MKRKKINNIIYAFDIETSTVNDITAHYLSSFVSVDFNLFRAGKDKILNGMSKAVFCRSAEDVDLYLIHLNNQAIEMDQITVIYCHNLAYEFDFLIKNSDFVKSNFSNLNSLFIKPRIPLSIQLDHLILRCSYRLLNMSLDQLGKNNGYNKLSIDYHSKYFDYSQLPDVEYEYNERDVRLTLLSILSECSKWSFIKDVNDIPMTSTSFTRKNNQKINSNADRKDYAGMCAYQKAYTKEYVNFLEQTFSGGYTHANAYYVNKPLKNVISMDIVSSYIDTIMHRDYPHFFHHYDGKYPLDFLCHMIKLNNADYMDVIKSYREPFKWSYMATITLKSVRAKVINNNLILPISASKCTKLSGIKLDNGRIYSAHLIKLNVTEVDYFIISQFYDFYLVDCEKLYYTKFHKPLADYVLNSTSEYLHEKSTLKKILATKHISKESFFNEKKDGYIYSEDQIESILALDQDSRDYLLRDNYRLAKNKLNAQYGINVQKLLNPEIIYSTDEDMYITTIEDHVSARVLYRDFCKGLYITAYSRLNLFCYGLYLINHCNTKLIYSDTDSWKCYGDIHKAIKVNEDYNILIESINHNSELYDIGKFDFEETYQYFSTLGCKKYITSDGSKIYVTIAGVNKKKTSQAFTQLYERLNYDFDVLCKVAFSPCTILSYSITGKLVSLYHNDPYSMDVIDENGDSGHISGTNMVELSPSDYILTDYDKHTVSEYINYFSELQNTPVNITPSIVYQDESGVNYKYITDWRETIKVLRGQDVNMENIVI